MQGPHSSKLPRRGEPRPRPTSSRGTFSSWLSPDEGTGAATLWGLCALTGAESKVTFSVHARKLSGSLGDDLPDGHPTRPRHRNQYRQNEPSLLAGQFVDDKGFQFFVHVDDSNAASGPSGSLLLSRKNFAFSASCRFSPAHCNRDFATAIGV